MKRIMTLLASRLPVIWEDPALIVVNKPVHMLSVPGRESRITFTSPKRHEQWLQAVNQFIDSVHSQSPIFNVMHSIKGRVEVPRSETKFIKYLQRASRVDDQSVLFQAWEELTEFDHKMNAFDTSQLPPHLVSAADIVEEHCGKRIMHVHRLDQETSGILAFAKTGLSASSISEQFRNHEVSN